MWWLFGGKQVADVHAREVKTPSGARGQVMECAERCYHHLDDGDAHAMRMVFAWCAEFR